MTKPTYVQEYKAITEVLNKHNDGCKQAKSSIMKPAFSDQATMFSVGVTESSQAVQSRIVRRDRPRLPSVA